MSTAALKTDALLPQPAGGHAPGAVLAALVHLGLITALTVGVDWRAQEREVVSAELWAAVPQTAAPPPAPEVAPAPPPAPPVPPAPPPPPPAPAARAEPPPPPEADIALQQERRRTLEADRKKAEQAAAELADKKARDKAVQQAEADRKKAAEQAAKDKQAKQAEDERKKREDERLAREKADDERLARQRDENLRRMMGQAGGAAGQTATTGTAARTAAPSAAYAGKVKAAVRPNIVFTGTASGSAPAEVEVSAAPGGSIIARRLTRSSGDKDWDEAVLRAIDKTQAMPRDTDGRVPATLIISFRPNE